VEEDGFLRLGLFLVSSAHTTLLKLGALSCFQHHTTARIPPICDRLYTSVGIFAVLLNISIMSSAVLFMSVRELQGVMKVVWGAVDNKTGSVLYKTVDPEFPEMEEVVFTIDAHRLLEELAPSPCASVEELSAQDHEAVLDKLLMLNKAVLDHEAVLDKEVLPGGAPARAAVDVDADIDADIDADVDAYDGLEAGRDFLACCDVQGSSLTFGAWHHRLGSGRGGTASYDICSEVYDELSPKERQAFVAIDSVRDMIMHLGPPEVTETIDLDSSPPCEDPETGQPAQEDTDSRAVDVTIVTEAVLDILHRLFEPRLSLKGPIADLRQVSAAEVLALLPQPPPPMDVVQAVMARHAKRSDGFHYVRGNGDPGTCVLTQVNAS